MKEIVLKVYINETFNDERALYNETTKEILLKGDYYHDKIDEKIEGFLKGLKYADIDFISKESEYIDQENPLFNELNFYNGC